MAPLQMLLETNANMHKLKSNHTHSAHAAVPQFMLSAQICMCTPANRNPNRLEGGHKIQVHIIRTVLHNTVKVTAKTNTY